MSSCSEEKSGQSWTPESYWLTQVKPEERMKPKDVKDNILSPAPSVPGTA